MFPRLIRLLQQLSHKLGSIEYNPRIAANVPIGISKNLIRSGINSNQLQFPYKKSRFSLTSLLAASSNVSPGSIAPPGSPKVHYPSGAVRVILHSDFRSALHMLSSQAVRARSSSALF